MGVAAPTGARPTVGRAPRCDRPPAGSVPRTERMIMTKKMCTTCAVFALSTCADGAPPTFPFSPEAGRLASFAEVFEVVDTLILEEDPARDVVTATPLVRFDGRQFWIADVAAYQAKVYAMDGSLLDARGRAGTGARRIRLSVFRPARARRWSPRGGPCSRTLDAVLAESRERGRDDGDPGCSTGRH